MNILVINCGSSSLKYQLISMDKELVLAKGLVERIGNEGSILTQKVEGGATYVNKVQMKDHKDAIKYVLEALTFGNTKVIQSLSEINAVGHRVVHGGESFKQSVVIDSKVKSILNDCIKLAPLHNPANIIGIEACEALLPQVPMIAVFDTAFHQTLPDYSYIYPLPYELYTEYGIRKYGFHGTSHKYVSEKAAAFLNKDITKLKMITCHLGNGASITALDGGRSIETSMGFTPLEGIAMGTRSGSIDPAIITYIQKEYNISIKEVENILNNKSGILGISGVSSDFRDVEKASKEGNARAKLALNVFYYKVKKFIGSYAFVLGGLDCLVFTAGLGENSAETREAICSNLEHFGIKIDPSLNQVRGKEAIISSSDSKVKVLVIPTNEELMIAKETMLLI
ncbi:MAG TPA: acetate kinase [Clostridiaceae bacterium]